ncbi:unnamed protein product, partial [Brenthis ino]
MANFICAGCPNTLDDTLALQCHNCKDKYHVICTRISKPDYSMMSSNMKSLWICDVCKCKQPRKGDHANTPVRSSPVEMDFVTQRVKSRPTCSCLSADSIREILREELSNILTNDLYPKIQKIQNTLVSLELSLTSLNTKLEKFKLTTLLTQHKYKK